MNMKMNFLSTLLKRKENLSGTIIYGKNRSIETSVELKVNKAPKTDLGLSIAKLFRGVEGLNVKEREIHTDRINAIRRSQRVSVQYQDSCLKRGFPRISFEN